jgi:hypothetical protein
MSSGNNTNSSLVNEPVMFGDVCCVLCCIIVRSRSVCYTLDTLDDLAIELLSGLLPYAAVNGNDIRANQPFLYAQGMFGSMWHGSLDSSLESVLSSSKCPPGNQT